MFPPDLLNHFYDICTHTGYDWTDLQEGFSCERVCSFRVNTLKTNTQDVETFCMQNDIFIKKILFGSTCAYMCKKKHEFFLKKSKLFSEGKIYLQGISSQIPVQILGIHKHQHILDATAAPGSKTTQMAAIMENTGKIIACEKNQIRFEKLSYNLRLQGVKNTQVLKNDVCKWAQHTTQTFDRILVDAPCSAQGRMNINNEKTYGFWCTDTPQQNAHEQKRILESVLPLLKLNGICVYSTCTLAPEENEGVITTLLHTFKDISLETCFFGKMGLNIFPGITSFRNTSFHKDIYKTGRIFPSQYSEGFFFACIKKIK